MIVAFPTGHAVGLRADSGVELLIHIGMDTVQLKGEHFASKVKVGTRVHRGQVLVEPEWDAIAAAGYDLTPGLESRSCCPEAIWQAVRWWQDYQQQRPDGNPSIRSLYCAPHNL